MIVNHEVENGKKEKGVAKEKPQPVKYYKGTYSSPFAMEVLAKMVFVLLSIVN